VHASLRGVNAKTADARIAHSTPNDVMKIIDDLIESERSLLTSAQFTGSQFAGFTLSWRAVERYHTFLTMISQREATATEAMSQGLQALRDTLSSRGPYQTEEQRCRLDELSKATNVLHLEIESFYLFAKILLDTVARAIEKYFGQARGCSLDSHHDLLRNFEKYTALKKLIVPTDFIEKATRLRKDVSDFRDQEIAHSKRRNKITGTALAKDGRRATLIATSTIVRPERLKLQASSIHVGELMSAVEDYIACAIKIVRTNRGKTIFTFAD